jgi:hypothetical protein
MSEAGGEESFWEAELRRFLPGPGAALEEGSGYVCCAVCYVLADLPFEYFRLLPKRWSEEPEVKEAVCRAGGFCNHHTWRLDKIQSQVIIAAVYADVLGRASAEGTTPEPCPVCRLQGLLETALLEEFARGLADASRRDQYGRLFGLCYPHFRRVLAMELEPGVREAIRQAQRERTGVLIDLLRAHIEKNEAPARWDRSEAENRAPRWALLKAAGNADL